MIASLINEIAPFLYFPVGAVLAGLPFSYLAKALDWRGAFMTLEVVSVVLLLLKLVTRNLEYKMVSIKKKLQ